MERELDPIARRHVNAILNNVDPGKETCFPLLLLLLASLYMVIACLITFLMMTNLSFPRQQYSA